MLAHPWLGYGFNQGVQALAESVVMLDPSGVTIATIQAHNFVLDLMVWVGIPLGLALAVGVSVWMLRLTRRHVELETMRQRHWIFALWLALFVQSLVEYPYAYGYFLLPAGLLAGASVEPAGADMGASEVRRYVSSRLAWCLALIATGLLAAITYDYWRLEDDYRFTRFVKANYINQPDHEFLDTPLLLDQVAMLNSTARYVLRRDMPATEIENLKAVARRYQNTVLQLNYAKALALNGQGAQARRELQIIRGMYQNASYVAVEKQWRDWLREHPGLAGDPP